MKELDELKDVIINRIIEVVKSKGVKYENTTTLKMYLPNLHVDIITINREEGHYEQDGVLAIHYDNENGYTRVESFNDVQPIHWLNAEELVEIMDFIEGDVFNNRYKEMEDEEI